MTRFIRQVLISAAGLTIFFVSSGQCAQGGASGKYGIGLFVDYLIPTSAFNTWHKPAPQFGANLSYKLDSVRRMAVEFEYHYTRFNHGRVETKSFIWGVDQKSYTSPNAKNKMTVSAGVVNTVLYLGKVREGGKAAPYAVIGTGFYNYVNRTSNLVYPGQKATPLNPNVVLEPREDNSTAFGVSLGFGTELRMSPSVGLDLRGNYHMIFGHINPMEAWGIKEVFPIQMADIRVAMRFYIK